MKQARLLATQADRQRKHSTLEQLSAVQPVLLAGPNDTTQTKPVLLAGQMDTPLEM